MSETLTPEEQTRLEELQAKAAGIAPEEKIARDANNIAPDAKKITPEQKEQVKAGLKAAAKARAKRSETLTPEELEADARSTPRPRKKKELTAEEQAAKRQTQLDNIAKANEAKRLKRLQSTPMDQLTPEEQDIVRGQLRRPADRTPKQEPTVTVKNLTPEELAELKFRKSPLGRVQSQNQADELVNKWAQVRGEGGLRDGAKILSIQVGENEVTSCIVLLSEGGRWTKKEEFVGRQELCRVEEITR